MNLMMNLQMFFFVFDFFPRVFFFVMMALANESFFICMFFSVHDLAYPLVEI